MEKARNTEEEKKMGQKWVKKEYEASETRINTGFPADTSTLSPMMKEYVKTKEEYSDCILFYRLGDFYEMFFEDALTASRELEITLTGKDCGLEERAPMCGVPFHAAETYINRLIEKGYKVAICEQVEDPKKAKGLVKREVVRIVTPGTTLDTMSLDESKNNYLMSIVSIGDHFGYAKGENVMGKLVGVLHRLGFDEVYDTSYGADLTVVEESKEFIERFTSGQKMPLFTSCCPAWVKYCETKYPEFVPNLSTCRSPQQMFGAVVREYYKDPEKNEGKKIVSVSIMPCTAKKEEILRPESFTNGKQDVDYVLTTTEVVRMIRKSGIVCAFWYWFRKRCDLWCYRRCHRGSTSQIAAGTQQSGYGSH